MNRQYIFALFVLVAILNNSVLANEQRARESSSTLPVILSVQSDSQGRLLEFPVNTNPLQYQAYIEAKQNDRYSLRVVNHSQQQVGIVIAVDGRNIIDGKQSSLVNSEQMYILNPNEIADYEGWRTGKNKTNRFYFTDEANSYAASIGDTSAIGVIAMAVFPAYTQPEPVIKQPAKVAKHASTKTETTTKNKTRGIPKAGTGFGESHYSPSVAVAFKPAETAMEKVFLKYEWHDALCNKGIITNCSANKTDNENNRLWQDKGFVPEPPN